MITNFDGEYAFLSNFYPSTIVDREGNVYPTVEHYFQAMKTLDDKEREAIRTAETPGQAKRLGRKCTLRKEWDKIRDAVMLTALIEKFSNRELREKLLATGEEFLAEGNTWGDTYWGVCEGKGRNMLGHSLMLVRAEIKEGRY